jgi:hypothetical protein
MLQNAVTSRVTLCIDTDNRHSDPPAAALSGVYRCAHGSHDVAAAPQALGARALLSWRQIQEVKGGEGMTLSDKGVPVVPCFLGGVYATDHYRYAQYISEPVIIFS